LSNTLDTVARLIGEVMSSEPLEPITEETSFGDDLELESIELVALAEKVQAEYGDKVNFADWLSQKELDELIHLKVGELVEFIDQCLAASGD
jgi:acyl carrier protein